MDTNEIKKLAAEFKSDDAAELNTKVSELKAAGASFLGCVAFVQYAKDMPLKEAFRYSLDMQVWEKERESILRSYHVMLNEINDGS